MTSPDQIFDKWHGIIDDDFSKTIRDTFELPADDTFVYRAESFAMTLFQIQSKLQNGGLKYNYQSHDERIEVPNPESFISAEDSLTEIPSQDITAYTSIFSPTTDSSKSLTAFAANAKKASPREIVARYLRSRRMCDRKIPKPKTHINPYYDIWVLSCQLTGFLGPLPNASYANSQNAKMTHPILPVLYHHFGCVVPSYEALYTISELVKENKQEGVIDMASGNGYWTYMLRRMKVDVVAVDNMTSQYRTMWIPNTVKSDGVHYLTSKLNSGGKGRILLMVYMVTAGTFTKKILKAYQGDIVVVVGTQNANRYTGFEDCTVEEYFESEMPGWEMISRIAMPSFAGKDDGMYVWRRSKR